MYVNTVMSPFAHAEESDSFKLFLLCLLRTEMTQILSVEVFDVVRHVSKKLVYMH